MHTLLVALSVLAAVSLVGTALLGWKLWRGVACTLALLSVFLALPGCSTALGQCELGKLPTILESVVADVTAIALEPTNYVADLTDLAKHLAPGQVDCAARAILAHAQAIPKAETSPQDRRETLAAHLREYLDARKAAGVVTWCTVVLPRG